jgi:KAP family P-loop domain
MTKQPIYAVDADIDPDQPFLNDLFDDRETLANRLTDVVQRMPSGGVIAIDARWGEGKTWFGKNWHAKLKKSGFKSAYVNAFAMDFVEDPFDMIVAEVIGALDSNHASIRVLKKSAGMTMKALLPKAVKVALKAGGAAIGVGGLVDTASEAINAVIAESSDEVINAAAEGAEKILEERLNRYHSEKKSIQEFRKTLADAVESSQGNDSASKKPLVIFIDELDRCRPDFAVKTIERVKHFFEVSGVVFVLLTNLEQLAEAVRGLYGPGLDAHNYLSKFIHLSCGLGRKTDQGSSKRRDELDAYISHRLIAVGIRASDNINSWLEEFLSYADYFNMSLRDMDRAVSILVLHDPNVIHAELGAWPIALKISKSKLFWSIVNDAHGAHVDAEQELSVIGQMPSHPRPATAAGWRDLHGVRVRPGTAPAGNGGNLQVRFVQLKKQDQLTVEVVRHVFSKYATL